MIEPSKSQSSDRILANLVEDLSQKLAAGDSAEVEAFLSEHANEADKLRQLIPMLRVLVELGSSPSSGQLSGDAIRAVLALETNQNHVLGDFRILQEVGRGGMGIVYEAEQISLCRRVALKVLPTASMLDPRSLQRFRNEAQAAAALHHSQIAPIFGVGCERGVHYYAMQFIDGLTLAEIISNLRVGAGLPASPYEIHESAESDSETRFESTPNAPNGLSDADTEVMEALSTETSGNSAARFRRLAGLFAQVADALDHAHDLGVTHRDIKPANLMLDRLGRIWVTDFGLARIEGAGNLTMTGDLVGTLRYMSPEQTLAKPVGVDHRTDIYSLGITLYELLALTPAFNGTGRQELARQISMDEPTSLRKRNPAIPNDLETIVVKATQKIPGERYQTAVEFAADLRRFVDDRHIVARRPSLGVRTSRWIKHRKGIVATVSILLLLASVVGLAWAYDRNQRTKMATALVNDALQESAFRRVAAEAKRDDLVAWEQAVSAAVRATAIADSGSVHNTLLIKAHNETSRLKTAYQQNVDRIAMSAKDARMLRDLDQARFELFAEPTVRPDGGKFRDRCDRAFKEYGIDLPKLDPNESGNLIKASAIRDDLVTGLIAWATVQSDDNKRGLTSGFLLELAARVASPSRPWQTELIQAMQSKNIEKLKEIANSDETGEYPPSAAFCLGMTLHDQGERNAAISITRKVLENNPGDFFLNIFYGDLIGGKRLHRFDDLSRSQEIADSLEQMTESIRFLTAAVALRPDSATPLRMLGRALQNQKQHDKALLVYEKAIRLNPQDASARSGIAFVFEDLGRFEETIASHKESIRLDPNFALGHMNLANSLMRKGKTEEALLAFRQAIAIDPTIASMHFNIGRLLKGQGKLDEAVIAYREAIRLDPMFIQAFNNLGTTYYEQDKFDEAVAAYREAIRLGPNHVKSYLNLAVALKHQGKLSEAVDAYREAIRLKPDAAEVYSSMGDAFIRQDKWEEALEALSEAIRIKPTIADTHFHMGRFLAHQGKLDEALESYRRAIELKPRFPEAFINMGAILKEQQQLVEAEAAYRKAILIYPQAVDATEGLRDTLRLLTLETEFAKALKESQTEISVAQRLEMAIFAFAQKHRPEIAVKWYEQAFKDEPECAEAIKEGHRYNATCASLLTASDQGPNSEKVDDAERARLQRQALDWLLADLAAWEKMTSNMPLAEITAVVQTLEHWKNDPDLASLRDEAMVKKLSMEDQELCRQLWAGHSELLSQLRESQSSVGK